MPSFQLFGNIYPTNEYYAVVVNNRIGLCEVGTNKTVISSRPPEAWGAYTTVQEVLDYLTGLIFTVDIAPLALFSLSFEPPTVYPLTSFGTIENL